MNIGYSIETLRKRAELTQEELAGKVGVSRPAISLIESGRATPHKATLTKLCKALNVTMVDVYILGMEEKDFPVTKRRKYRLLYPMVKAIIMEITK